MKKRIGVILVLMMMLWGTPVFGEELTIDSLRFVKSDFLVEERCIIEGCEYSIDEYVDIIDLQELEVGRKDIKNTISTLGGWCQNHTMRENFFATDLKAVYTEEEAGLLHINWDGKSEILENRVSALTLEDYRSRKSSNACEDCGRYLPRATANLFLDAYYSPIEINGSKYYVYKDLFKLVDKGANTEFAYTQNNNLCLVKYDTYCVELCVPQKVENAEENELGINKYASEWLYFAKDYTSDGFFICEEHFMCANSCVYSLACSDPTSGELVVSIYCSDCACSFIWDVSNDSESGDHEYLACRAERSDEYNYCDRHKCKLCDKPVIGINTNYNPYLELASYNEGIEHYTGNLEDKYSLGCEEHYCRAPGCIETISEDGGNFCSTHNSKCFVKDCDNNIKVFSSFYSGYIVCDIHRLCGTIIINENGHSIQTEIIQTQIDAQQRKHYVRKYCENCNMDFVVITHECLLGECEDEECIEYYRNTHPEVQPVEPEITPGGDEENVVTCEGDHAEAVITYEKYNDYWHYKKTTCSCGYSQTIGLAHTEDCTCAEPKFLVAEGVDFNCTGGYGGHDYAGFVYDPIENTPGRHIKYVACSKCETKIGLTGEEEACGDSNPKCNCDGESRMPSETICLHEWKHDEKLGQNEHLVECNKCHNAWQVQSNDGCAECSSSQGAGSETTNPVVPSGCTHSSTITRYSNIANSGYHIKFTICQTQGCGYIGATKEAHKGDENGHCKDCQARQGETVNGNSTHTGECSWITVKAPLCNRDGSKDTKDWADTNHCIYEKCSVCHEVKGTPVRYEGHTYSSTTTIGQAEYEVCSVCGYNWYIGEAGGPDEGGEEAPPAGNTTTGCTHSGKFIKYSNVAGTGKHLKFTICTTCGGPVGENENLEHVWQGERCRDCMADKETNQTVTPTCSGNDHTWTIAYARLLNTSGNTAWGDTNHIKYNKCTKCSATGETLGYEAHSGWKDVENGKECAVCGYTKYVKGNTPGGSQGSGDKGNGNGSGNGGSSSTGGDPSGKDDGKTDDTTTPGTDDTNKCTHAGYLVVLHENYLDITDTTHKVEGTCMDCDTKYVSEWQHVYVNGKCECGHELPTEIIDNNNLIKIEVISPKAEKLKGGELIKVKVTGNKNLLTFKYVFSWGDKDTKVQLVNNQVEVGNIPAIDGKYYFYIYSVTDTNNNETVVNAEYEFVVDKKAADLEDEPEEEDNSRQMCSNCGKETLFSTTEDGKEYCIVCGTTVDGDKIEVDDVLIVEIRLCKGCGKTVVFSETENADVCPDCGETFFATLEDTTEDGEADSEITDDEGKNEIVYDDND